MEVSGQLQALATLALVKEPPVDSRWWVPIESRSGVAKPRLASHVQLVEICRLSSFLHYNSYKR
jgi:hypothetical protein